MRQKLKLRNHRDEPSKKVKCEFCNKSFKKRIADYNRTEREGRKHFCSLNCAAKYGRKHHPHKNMQKLKKRVDKEK